MASSSLVGGLRTFRKWMFDVQAFEGSFQGGIVSDMEPWQTPVGGSVQLRDFLTDNTGKLRKRGGTIYQSGGVTPTGSTGGPIFVAVMCPEFDGFDPRILAIASNGAAGRTLYDLTNPAVAGPELAIGVQPYENPTIVESNGMVYVIVCDGQNHGPIKKITRPGAVGTPVVVGTLTSSGLKVDGTPTDPIPNAMYSTAMGRVLILANDGAAHQNRVWYGPTSNNIEGAWDTGQLGSWTDLDAAVTGLTAHAGVHLIWTRRKLYRALGDTPPGVLPDRERQRGRQHAVSAGRERRLY